MEKMDPRAPFAAISGVIPPEFDTLLTPCYLIDEAALAQNAAILGRACRPHRMQGAVGAKGVFELRLLPDPCPASRGHRSKRAV